MLVCFGKVCGVEALKAFSHNFLKPYEPEKGEYTVEEMENRVTTLQQQLTDAEAELERLRKGKQKV